MLLFSPQLALSSPVLSKHYFLPPLEAYLLLTAFYLLHHQLYAIKADGTAAWFSQITHIETKNVAERRQFTDAGVFPLSCIWPFLQIRFFGFSVLFQFSPPFSLRWLWKACRPWSPWVKLSFFSLWVKKMMRLGGGTTRHWWRSWQQWWSREAPRWSDTCPAGSTCTVSINYMQKNKPLYNLL